MFARRTISPRPKTGYLNPASAVVEWGGYPIDIFQHPASPIAFTFSFTHAGLERVGDVSIGFAIPRRGRAGAVDS